jgi:predicted nucleotidyltransferase
MLDTSWQHQHEIQAIIAQQPYRPFFVTLSGSHLYGFPSPDSDYDVRGTYILPVHEIAGLSEGPATIERTFMHADLEIDLVMYDVKKFFALLLKKNGLALEQIFSPLVVLTSPEHEELKALTPRLITRQHYNHYYGFAEAQWKLFNRNVPHRVKPLLYIYRVLLTGIHLMRTGAVEANLVHLHETFQLPYIPELIARKLTGPEKAVLEQVDLPFHEQEYKRLLQELKLASENSTLPDEPANVDRQQLNDLLLRLRLG